VGRLLFCAFAEPDSIITAATNKPLVNVNIFFIFVSPNRV
jgi:hypothetical protein